MLRTSVWHCFGYP